MILLLGCSGFLGGHFRQYLLERQAADDKVADRVALVSRTQPDWPCASHESWVSAADFEGPEGDRLIAEATSIVHLISVSTPGTFADKPWQDLSENVVPLMQLLQRVERLNKAARIVFVSTGGAIYGAAEGGRLLSETVQPRPISSYGYAKLCAENALRFFADSAQLDFRVLRVANPVGVHGLRKRSGFVAAALRAARNDETLTIFGDGRNVRDLLAADDVAAAIGAAIADQHYPGRVWNIGSGVGRSIIDTLEIVENAIGFAPRIEFRPARQFDVGAVVLDCSRAKAELGWSADSDLTQVVRGMWAVFAAQPVAA